MALTVFFLCPAAQRSAAGGDNRPHTLSETPCHDRTQQLPSIWTKPPPPCLPPRPRRRSAHQVRVVSDGVDQRQEHGAGVPQRGGATAWWRTGRAAAAGRGSAAGASSGRRRPRPARRAAAAGTGSASRQRPADAAAQRCSLTSAGPSGCRQAGTRYIRQGRL